MTLATPEFGAKGNGVDKLRVVTLPLWLESDLSTGSGATKEKDMPELICELIVSLDGYARGQRSPGDFGYFGRDFTD